MKGWTLEESTQAVAEGWDLFTIENSATLPPGAQEIQMDGDSDVFNGDPQAVAHVYWRATEGSPLHMRALLLSLQTCAPATYAEANA